MKTLSAVVTFVSRALFSAAGVALTAMVFLTGADVLLRYLGRPIVGTYEMVGLLGALMTGFALPQTSRVKGHVIMDFVVPRLSAGLQRFFEILTRALGIVLFAIIGWEVWLLAEDYRKLGEASLTLAIPLYPVAYIIAICCFVEIIVLFLEMVEGAEQDAET